MFGLGFTEILLLALVAFLALGPKQFPAAARNFIKLLNELKRAWGDVQADLRDVKTEAQRHIQDIAESAAKESGFKEARDRIKAFSEELAEGKSSEGKKKSGG